VIIFTYVNYRGVSLTGKVGNILTFTQLAIIFSCIAAGIFAWGFVNHNWTVNFQNFIPKGFVGLMLGMGITYIAFEGYEIIVQTGEEVKNPKKNIPKAIFITLGIVTTIYILFTFSFLVGLDPSKIGTEAWRFIGDHQELGIPRAAQFLLPFGTIIVLAGGMVSTVAGLSATTFSSSRVSFAMGRQYNLPYIFSSIHSKYHTPHFAIIASGFIMLIMASWLPVTQLAIAAGVLFLFLFTQVNWAGIQIRRLYGHKLDYGFKNPLSSELGNCYCLDIDWFFNLQTVYCQERNRTLRSSSGKQRTISKKRLPYNDSLQQKKCKKSSKNSICYCKRQRR
jgi:amino acid transporter